jgi:hypothetical protein
VIIQRKFYKNSTIPTYIRYRFFRLFKKSKILLLNLNTHMNGLSLHSFPTTNYPQISFEVTSNSISESQKHELISLCSEEALEKKAEKLALNQKRCNHCGLCWNFFPDIVKRTLIE